MSSGRLPGTASLHLCLSFDILIYVLPPSPFSHLLFSPSACFTPSGLVYSLISFILLCITSQGEPLSFYNSESTCFTPKTTFYVSFQPLVNYDHTLPLKAEVDLTSWTRLCRFPPAMFLGTMEEKFIPRIEEALFFFSPSSHLFKTMLIHPLVSPLKTEGIVLKMSEVTKSNHII